MKDVQCYELFGGIELKNHAFSFFSFYMEHAFACPSHCFRACGSPDVLTFAKKFKKCDVGTCSDVQRCYV